MGSETPVGLSLLVVLLGGFVFVSLCNLTRYWCSQFAGHRLYFTSAVAGLLSFILAQVLLSAHAIHLWDSVIDWAFKPSLLFCSTAILLGGIGHVLSRWAEFREKARWRILLNIFVLGLVLITTFLIKTESVPLRFTLADFTTATFSFAIAIVLLAPIYTPRKSEYDGDNDIPRVVGAILRPRAMSGHFANWFVASFRIGTAGLLTLVFLGVLTVGLEHTNFLLEFFSLRPGEERHLIAAGIASFLWFPVNLLIPGEVAKDFLVSRGAEDSLEGIFWSVVKNDNLIELDLSNGKVYIGWIIDMPPKLGPKGAYIELLPLFSGYRHSETHRLVLTTFYHTAYGGGQSDSPNLSIARRRSLAMQFNKVIDLGVVVSASRFDPRVYESFARQ